MKRPPLTLRTLIGFLLLGQSVWEKLKPAPAPAPTPPIFPGEGGPAAPAEPEPAAPPPDPFRW